MAGTGTGIGNGGFVINGQVASDQSGLSISAAGDVNGDGLADLIVGAPYGDPAGGTDAGRSYVVFGKTGNAAISLSTLGTGGSSSMAWVPATIAATASPQPAMSTATVWPILIVGAPNNGVGQSYVVFGKTDSTAIDLSAIANGIGGFVITGQSIGDQSGFSVSAAG